MSYINNTTETKESRIKRLKFRANHRGTKESDIIVGGFTNHNIEQMSDDELDELEVILQQIDNDIVDWYMGRKEVPEELRSDLLTKLMQHKVA
jgi:antitoxin CptB